MKILNRFNGLLFSVMLAIGIIFTSTVSYADYQYTVRIYLGGTGNEGASFVSVPDKDYIEYKVAAGETVTFDPTTEVKISSENAKYLPVGLRPSGNFSADAMITSLNKAVNEDETYVVAYAVYKTVPYTAVFVNGAGEKIAEDQTYYGIKGHKFYAPYKEIDGYDPVDSSRKKEINLTTSGEEIKFEYKDRVGGTTYETRTNTEYATVVVPGETTYQDITGMISDTITSPGGVVNNRDQTATGNAGGNTNENPVAPVDEAAGERTPSVDNNDNADEGIEIPEEEVARNADQRGILRRYVFFLAVVAIMGLAIVIISFVGVVMVNNDKKHKN